MVDFLHRRRSGIAAHRCHDGKWTGRTSKIEARERAIRVALLFAYVGIQSARVGAAENLVQQLQCVEIRRRTRGRHASHAQSGLIDARLVDDDKAVCSGL